ncbi:MAG: hypothetical protein GY810_11680 [Aureispira sp.]|nr:hypothetical protein [Aureispira sp.]
MKKIFFVLIALGILTACKKENTTSGLTEEPTICEKDSVTLGLVDEWRLIEMLADPGNGSGTFSPVSSSKTIEFHSNGTVSSNGNLCSMNSASNTASTGTYSTVDSTISGSTCASLNFTLSGNTLIINYPCIEPCRAKFERQ